jgi:hypothetical protein
MHALYQRATPTLASLKPCFVSAHDTHLGKLKTVLCNKGTNLFVPKTTKNKIGL